MAFRIGARMAALALALASTFGTAGAVVIPAEARLGEIPAAPGAGLTALYYRLGGYTPTVTTAFKVASNLPNATAVFTASTVCFPRCGATAKDGGSIADYVAANGTNLTGGGVTGPSYTVFSGALAIAKPGVYTFSLYSDDGAMLTIGGTQVAAMLATQPWAGTSVEATFQAAGLYAIEIAHFDIGGYTGITVLENSAAIPTASLYGASGLPNPSASLAAVPEPGPLGVLAMGVLSLTMLARRRDRRDP